MTTLNLSEVAKQFRINRSTIYRAVSSGKLSRLADGSFDLAEVVRCFGEPKKVAVSQQSKVAVPQQNTDEELERVRKEFSDYKRQAQDREEWLKTQIDRMQTLLEMKVQPVASETPRQQSQATSGNTADEVHETIVNKEDGSGATVQDTPAQRVAESQRNTAHSTVEQPEKKRGLLGRVIRAVLD